MPAVGLGVLKSEVAVIPRINTETPRPRHVDAPVVAVPARLVFATINPRVRSFGLGRAVADFSPRSQQLTTWIIQARSFFHSDQRERLTTVRTLLAPLTPRLPRRGTGGGNYGNGSEATIRVNASRPFS